MTFLDLLSDALVMSDNAHILAHQVPPVTCDRQIDRNGTVPVHRTYPYICGLVLSGELRSTNLSTILTVSMLVGY